MSWCVYIVECVDGSYYTGVTTDVARRVEEHNDSPRGARYTRARRPVRLAASWPVEDRAEACRAEAAIKQLSRPQKDALVRGEVEFDCGACDE